MKDWLFTIVVAVSLLCFVIFCSYIVFLGISMIAFLVAATIEYRCIKWTWTGDVFNRKVVCIEWKKVEKNDPVRPDKRPK